MTFTKAIIIFLASTTVVASLTQVQIQLDDSMSALAVLAMITAAGVAIHSGRAARGAADNWRRWSFGVGAGLGLYTAVAYAIVLFVDATANTAWLRPAILFWMLHYLVVMRVIETVVTTSPSEQMAAENQRLEDKIRGAQSAANTWQGVTDGYKEREAKWAGEKDRLIDDATEIRKALEREREILAETRKQAGIIFDAKMRAEETVAKQEDAIDALKRQIVAMEAERRRGRDG